MQRQVLTEQSLYYGDVAMPKDWDIDRDKLSGDILQSVIQKHLEEITQVLAILGMKIIISFGLNHLIHLG